MSPFRNTIFIYILYDSRSKWTPSVDRRLCLVAAERHLFATTLGCCCHLEPLPPIHLCHCWRGTGLQNQPLRIPPYQTGLIWPSPGWLEPLGLNWFEPSADLVWTPGPHRQSEPRLGQPPTAHQRSAASQQPWSTSNLCGPGPLK